MTKNYPESIVVVLPDVVVSSLAFLFWGMDFITHIWRVAVEYIVFLRKDSEGIQVVLAT